MQTFPRWKIRNDVDLSRSVDVTPEEIQFAIVVTPELEVTRTQARRRTVTIAVNPRPQQPPSPVHHHRRGHQSNPAEATFTTVVEKQQSQVGQLIGLHQRFQEIEKLWEEDLKRVVTRRKILDFSF
nr:hypothetical protein Iba_chr04aCG4740 [Ipomoea batatas]